MILSIVEIYMMNVYYLYILHSEASHNYYVGYSINPYKRLIEHNTVDHLTLTSKFRPWLLKAIFPIGENEGIAIKIERLVKRQHSSKLIEKLIDPGFVPYGKLAQLVIPQRRDASAGLIRGSLVQSF